MQRGNKIKKAERNVFKTYGRGRRIVFSAGCTKCGAFETFNWFFVRKFFPILSRDDLLMWRQRIYMKEGWNNQKKGPPIDSAWKWKTVVFGTIDNKKNRQRVLYIGNLNNENIMMKSLRNIRMDLLRWYARLHTLFNFKMITCVRCVFTQSNLFLYIFSDLDTFTVSLKKTVKIKTRTDKVFHRLIFWRFKHARPIRGHDTTD